MTKKEIEALKAGGAGASMGISNRRHDFSKRAPEKDSWLDESRILPTTQTWIQVDFFVETGAGDDELLKNFYNTMSHREYGKLTIPRYYIQNAEFDGVQIGARKGSITIIDPENTWSRAFDYIGYWKNKNAGRPNMSIQFGWVDLKAGAERGDMVQTIPAILLKTGFNMNENGIVTITLEFIENTERILDIVKFNKLEDLTLLNSEVNGDLKKMSVKEILEFVIATDGIKAQLETFDIHLSFDDTFEMNDDKFGETGVDIKIRLGDTLGSKINEIISKATPDTTEKDFSDKGWLLASYVMKDKEIKYKTVNGKTHYHSYILFGWRYAVTDEGRAGNLKKWQIEKYTMGVESESDIEELKGPTLLWKKQSMNYSEKTLLTFDVDLKMLDYATSMIKSELDTKLSQFNEEDWGKIAEVVQQIQEKGDTDAKALLTMNPQQLSEKATSEGKSFGLSYDVGAHIFGWGISEDDKARTQIIDEFNEVLRNSSSNVTKAIGAIIHNNVFKAKAKIMGDPSFGTDYTMFNVYFDSDFNGAGSFAAFFTRKWLLTKVSHKIEEGSYFTELEIMALPIEPPKYAHGNVK